MGVQREYSRLHLVAVAVETSRTCWQRAATEATAVAGAGAGVVLGDRVEAEPRAEPRWLMPICEPRVETDGAFGDKRLCMRCPEGSPSDRHESRLKTPLVGEHVPTQCSCSFACGGG